MNDTGNYLNTSVWDFTPETMYIAKQTRLRGAALLLCGKYATRVYEIGESKILEESPHPIYHTYGLNLTKREAETLVYFGIASAIRLDSLDGDYCYEILFPDRLTEKIHKGFENITAVAFRDVVDE